MNRKFNANKSVQKSVVHARIPRMGKIRFVNERTCPYPEKFCYAAIRPISRGRGSNWLTSSTPFRAETWHAVSVEESYPL